MNIQVVNSKIFLYLINILIILFLQVNIHATPLYDENSINVMTYNVHYGMNSGFTNTGSNSSLDAVIKYIKNNNINIVLLQEFPHGKNKYGAYLKGDRKKYKSYLRNKLPDFSISEAITRDGNKFIGGKSLVILTNLKVLEVKTLFLPQPLWHQARKVLVVRLNINNTNLWVANIHLYHELNETHHNDLHGTLNWLDKIIPGEDPLILGGDFNFDERRNKKSAQKYLYLKSKNFKDSYYRCNTDKKYSKELYRSTFPVKNIRIDYLFFKNLSCHNYWRGSSNSSDHHAVFTTYIVE